MLNKLLFVLVVIVAVGALAFVPSPLPRNFPANDFRGYWSASYLLARGENFTDAPLMFQIELTRTDMTGTYPIVTWNPPWLLVFLLPFTFVSFEHALFAWMITSIALIFASAIVFWQIAVSKESSRRRAWIALLSAFAFSPTLTALVAGQVNVLVLAGVVGYLYLTHLRREASAGVCLALTTIKPQMVYLTLPLLLLELVLSRRWRALAGFGGTLVGLTLIALVLRPTLPFDYFDALGHGNLLAYETPTLGGWLAATTGWQGFKLMGILILPVCLWLYWRERGRWSFATLVDITLILSVLTAPFGWSYDFVILLVPLWRIIARIVEGEFNSLETLVLGAALLIADAVTYYQRVSTDRELVFAWVPLFVLALYTFLLWQPRKPSTALSVSKLV